MIEIKETWLEGEELDAHDPLEISVEKWKKINILLSKLSDVDGSATCGLCRVHRDLDCGVCPLLAHRFPCNNPNSLWIKFHTALTNAEELAYEMYEELFEIKNRKK